MSTSEGEAQLPSYEALCAAQQHVRDSPEARRLFWSLDGPLESAVYIMASQRDPSSLEPYFQNQTWHPFSQAPLTEPKVSSVTVAVDDLTEWEDSWLECHRGCSDPDYHKTNPDVQWGDLPDYDPTSDEDGPTHLLKCCGTQRPRGKAVSVVVSPAIGPFVTIHDYLSTVHPVLLSARDDILCAMGVWDYKPLPEETKLMVYLIGPSYLFIRELDDWIKEVTIPPNPLLVPGKEYLTEQGHCY
ncbi:hypothetical protein LX32DRAFT_115290 [Colletotrichum zoysiae]|uniref:Uncharacterized protein n=1 Tax=Colletotrichum zoysiae TaxID=1216348 RepID=A0AAD9LWV1_9PEZI|nr:hypothetical protein LX32DRAFT_115290 [Colletotrichum zoysiae]